MKRGCAQRTPRNYLRSQVSHAGLIMKGQFKLELPLLQPEDTDAVNLSPIATPSPRYEYRDAPVQLIEYFPDSGSKL